LFARNTFNLVIPGDFLIFFTENSNSDESVLSPLKTLHLPCNDTVCIKIKNNNILVRLVARMKNLSRDYFCRWANIKVIKLINWRMGIVDA